MFPNNLTFKRNVLYGRVKVSLQALGTDAFTEAQIRASFPTKLPRRGGGAMDSLVRVWCGPVEAGLGSRSPSEARINGLGEGRSLYMTMLSGVGK